jgi:nucleoside-triphosphatase
VKNERIYIMSEPVQSGKTTMLMNWVKTRNDVGGMLTPDILGKRKLMDIENNTWYDFEKEATYTGKAITVGKYYFDADIFGLAQKILLNTLKHNYGWIVVDEIGKLELHQQTGLEPAVSQLIEHYQKPSTTGNLMLVIRDYLLTDCVKHYDINEAVIFNKSNFDLVVATK